MAADSTIKQLFAELASLNLQLEAAKSEARDRDVLLHKLQAETDRSAPARMKHVCELMRRRR